jgi:hypothetical protein
VFLVFPAGFLPPWLYFRVRFCGCVSVDRNLPVSCSFKVSDHRRNAPKSGQNRLESLCAGLWVPCRNFWFLCGTAIGLNPDRSRRFPFGSLKVFGALLFHCSINSLRFLVFVALVCLRFRGLPGGPRSSQESPRRALGGLPGAPWTPPGPGQKT